MIHWADQLEKWLVAPSEPAPLPPLPPCLRMRTTATGVEFRPLPRPLGRFRLFVLLIVDLTRIQPNIQRTALLPNRLVLPGAFPPGCVLCPRRLCHRFMVPVCAPLLLVFRSCLFRLVPRGMLCVGLCICAAVDGGAGPCSRAPGMLLFKGERRRGGTCMVTELLIRDSPRLAAPWKAFQRPPPCLSGHV